MIEKSIKRLELLCDTIPALLSEIGADLFSVKSSPEKWSRKEIIGHLIDSATNNHHRLVRGQFESSPQIIYDQNQWNAYGYYQQMEGAQVIAFWTAYNRQLLELVRRIPQPNLSRTVKMGQEQEVTLGFVIEDYVRHLEHHLQQVVAYTF